MALDEVRKLYFAEPFQPFHIRLTDGRSIYGAHREFMASAPRGRTIVVYQPDGGFNIIDLLLVSDVEVRADGETSTNGPRT